MLDLVTLLLVITAALAYINVRFIKLPPAIGLLLTALVSALLVKGAALVGLVDLGPLVVAIEEIDFRDALLDVMLAPLLFAAALHVDWSLLRAQKWPVLTLATVGTVLAALLIALGLRLAAGALGYDIPFLWSLAFGVLLAPTDPIAVGALLKKAGVPPQLQMTITGESLFNDGLGVVLFLGVVGALVKGAPPSGVELAELLAVEVGGGLLLGLALGWVAVRLLREVDNYQVEILCTLALVFGGFLLARYLHVSGVLGMVIAGLMLGQKGREQALSARTQQRLDEFWELIDEFLNAALFVLIGVEVLVIDLDPRALGLGLLMVPLSLLARFVAVVVPLAPLQARLGWPAGGFRVLTWAGVRGGISIALALALPPGDARSTILTVAYVVVCFSVVVQGLTMERVAKRVLTPTSA
jgi:monovalent cation:H+ antiporter, CPA1 family